MKTDGLDHRFIHGTAEAFVLRLAGFGVLFLMHVVLARRLGPEGYGVINYTLAQGEVRVGAA
jgi:O-antigen/teichoic acid export membrane protein